MREDVYREYFYLFCLSPESSASVNAGEEDGGRGVHDRDKGGGKLQPVPTNAVRQMVLFSQQQNKVVLVRDSDLEPIQVHVCI